jgi:5-methylcytosine-specific restriction enzyme A
VPILYACPDCGALTPDTRCPKHAKVKRRKRYARQDASRRARGKRNGSTSAYRKERAFVLERDKGICWICRKAGANTADHIVPVSKDGSDHRSNLRAAHKSCNSRRGAN